MKIEYYTFSTTDIVNVHELLNEFLKHISLVVLSRDEVDSADPQKRFIGNCDRRYHDIVKIINRWGIKEDGRYYELLNDTIGGISSCYPTLLIYKPIELLLFNKLLEGWSKGEKTEFTKEEIEVFFLQPANMINSSCVYESGLYLMSYDLLSELQSLLMKMKSEDSKKFLNEGVGRRLFMLKTSVDSISRIYNEHRINFLTDNENAILSQNINFFYANVYAIADCLAWVFASEYPGYKIDKRKDVGLFNKKFYPKINGLSEKLNLNKLRPWYDEIVELRDPIAHRIPLYFPEIYKEEDARKIKKVRDRYSKNFNDIFKNRKVFTDNEKDQISKQMNESNKLNDAINRLREERQKAESYINVFSGCFLHSYGENKKHYHLSRLTLDLGILYYLLDKSFEYLCEICG
jgi:hypothetical protein